MGACSSKPKTTEFEGSTEPSKNADLVTADRSIDAALVLQENEPIKDQNGGPDAGKETGQEACEPIVHQDEESLKKELSGTAEGVSSSLKFEPCAAGGGTNNGSVKKSEGEVDAQKTDARDCAADDKEVNNMTATEDGGADGDKGKLFDDKSVVLNELSNSVVDKGSAYIDKAVAASEEKAHESSDDVCSSTADESANLQDAFQAHGAGSPIIGVVQVSEPIQVDDISGNIGSATPETVTPKDSESVDEISLTGQHVGEGVNTSVEAAADLSSGLPLEAPEEKEEVLHDDSKSSHPSVGVPDDGVGQKSEVDDAIRGEEEVHRPSAHLQDETVVEDTTKPEVTLDPQNDPEEKTSLPQEESVLEESARESQIAVTENEGNSVVPDEPEAKTVEVHENIDAGTLIEPTDGIKAEQATEGQVEGTVDKPNASNIHQRDFEVERTQIDGKPEAASIVASAEPIVEANTQTGRDEMAEKPQIEEATMNGGEVENADAGKEETHEREKKPSVEGDVAFEDASDVPLKVESSMELGDTGLKS